MAQVLAQQQKEWVTTRDFFIYFFRVFVTSDVRARRWRLVSCFGVDFFRTGIKVEDFQRDGTERWCMEVWKKCRRTTELISTTLQSSAVSITKSQALLHINPLQQSVHKVFLNYNVSFMSQWPFVRSAEKSYLSNLVLKKQTSVFCFVFLLVWQFLFIRLLYSNTVTCSHQLVRS